MSWGWVSWWLPDKNYPILHGLKVNIIAFRSAPLTPNAPARRPPKRRTLIVGIEIKTAQAHFLSSTSFFPDVPFFVVKIFQIFVKSFYQPNDSISPPPPLHESAESSNWRHKSTQRLLENKKSPFSAQNLPAFSFLKDSFFHSLTHSLACPIEDCVEIKWNAFFLKNWQKFFHLKKPILEACFG